MPRLVACPHCQSHALTIEARCPHCGGSLRARNGRLALTTAAVLMGLAPMGCEKDGPGADPPTDSGGVAEPEYGVPVTPDAPDQPDPGADDPNAPSDPDHNPEFEAEYGVPTTDDAEDQAIAPMYGVPDAPN